MEARRGEGIDLVTQEYELQENHGNPLYKADFY